MEIIDIFHAIWHDCGHFASIFHILVYCNNKRFSFFVVCEGILPNVMKFFKKFNDPLKKPKISRS
jgi:hypothetical protein